MQKKEQKTGRPHRGICCLHLHTHRYYHGALRTMYTDARLAEASNFEATYSEIPRSKRCEVERTGSLVNDARLLN